MSIRQFPSVIIQRAATISGYGIEEITGKRRQRELTMVRHCAIWLMKRNTGLTQAEIGRYFNMDHTSIIHACKKVEDYLQTKDELYLPIHEAIVNGAEFSYSVR